jgi:hypothetical protein
MENLALWKEVKSSSPERPPPRLLYRIRDSLQSGGWKFSIEEARSLIKFVVSANGVDHDVFIVTDEKNEALTILLSYRRKTPQKFQKEMARLIGQLTLKIRVGGFEMDPGDGEVRLRHSVDVEGIEPPNGWFSRIVKVHTSTGAQLWPSVESVMNGRDWRTALGEMA